ncbi:MAG: DUF5615 family PIN-like protein [Angustibacter sp.]
MRLLIDANLSPSLVAPLQKVEHEAVHVCALGMQTATDDAIFDHAAREQYVVVTADSDFPKMLATRGVLMPSVVHLRGINRVAPPDQAALLCANLPLVTMDLRAGAIVSLSPRRLAVRSLPLG